MNPPQRANRDRGRDDGECSFEHAAGENGEHSSQRATSEAVEHAICEWPRALLLVCLLLALACSVEGLHRALANRAALRLILDSRWGITLAALAAGIALGVGALARELARLPRRERAESTLAFLRKLFCVAVAGWIFFLWRMQPFQRIHFDLALGIAAGIFSGLIAIEPWLARMPRGVRRAADIASFNLCLALFGGEIALRALSVWKPSFVLARVASSPGQVLERNRCRPGQMRFGFPCNTGGHYDGEFHRKRAGEHLVATIGDSFSIGVVPHALHFTTVCERDLGVDVYNVGVSGADPPEYLHMLINEALPLDPDVVVIDVFVGNDIVFPPHTRTSTDAGLRSWFDSGNVLLCLVPDRLARLAREQRSRTAEQGPVGVVQGERANAGGEDEVTVKKNFPWVADPGQELATFSEAAFAATEAGRVSSVCGESSPSFAPFFETLSDIQRAARATRLFVMLIPDEFQVEDAVWQLALAGATEKNLERDRPQRILLPWFEQQGIPCLDLLPILRATAPLADGRRHLYHLRDTHFNARGNHVAGEALAEFLREHAEFLGAPAMKER
jgi:hypothetical protein